MTNNKDFFVQTLLSTGRPGIENVIAKLDELGFFKAPASTVFHLNCEGGLLQHSINVYRQAMAVREKQIELCPEIEPLLPVESIAIAALLHDTCKAEIYKKALKSRKNDEGLWEKYWGYDVNYSDFPMGHGEKSVIRLLQWGLQLTEDEMLAIRWHMGPWDLPFQSAESKACISEAKNKAPLLAVISAADGLASFILERK